MKIAVMIAVALIVLSSVPLFGQQANAGAQSSASISTGTANMSQSGSANATAGASRSGLNATGNANSSSAVSMRPVRGELMGSLDAKHAKVGDRVVVKTTQTFETAEGTKIPKGSKLIGHVSEVEARESGNANSRLGLVFDHVELKGGGSMAIHAVIESVSPSESELAAAQMDRRDEMSAMNGSMVGGRPMGAARTGGGLLSGAVGGTSSTAANAGAGMRSTTGSALGATGNLAGDTTEGVGNSLNGSAHAVAGVGADASTIPGVALESRASSTTSGVLTASKRNVHLDSGTRMTLGVAGSVAH